MKIPFDPELAAKEFRDAEADPEAAERLLADPREKWAIIQGYYSLFDSLRATRTVQARSGAVRPYPRAGLPRRISGNDGSSRGNLLFP